MVEADKANFFKLVASVYAFYRQDCSSFALSVWWEGCKPFDYEAVHDAMNRHAVNPDNGQFLPKPADVVKLIGGGSQDAALVAWAKVERAIRRVGIYQSVVFDDPIIHAVLRDMGEWIKLCQVTEHDLPFRAKEFENRYRGYRTRGAIEDFPKYLIGLAEAHNTAQGLKTDPPVLLGDADKCMRVLSGPKLLTEAA